MKLRNWVAELRRRHVIRVALAYVVVAWVVIQVSQTLAPELGLPSWTTRFVIVVAALGLPVALVLSWLFDVRPTSAIETTEQAATTDEGQTGQGPPSDRRRIAVLPFDSFSAAGEDEYFADGITEELTSVISRVSGLEVIARTSVMPYKRDPQPVSVIARDLQVGSVLEGSIRRAGDRIRVTVQLIDTASEAHLWADDYDRELSDIFAIQTEIARSVADALRVRLVSGEEDRISNVPTRDLEAHDLYLLGRHHVAKRNHDSLLRAIDLFEQALEKDPSFALAAAGLGEAWFWASIGYVMELPPDAAARSREAAERGVRLDDRLSETHIALALIANFQEDLDIGWKALEQAIELNPSSAPAHEALALHWILRGDFDEALRLYERAVELDPRSANARLEAGWPHAYEMRYEEALRRADEALAIDPDSALGHLNRGAYLDALGDGEGAMKALRRSLELGGLWGLTKGFMVRALAKRGDQVAAREITDEIVRRADAEPGLHMSVAIAYDALGEPDRAVERIERAAALREPHADLLHLVGFLPFEATRDHPRFQAIEADNAKRFGRA